MNDEGTVKELNDGPENILWFAEFCKAGKDGDCNWAGCPQEIGDRANYKPHCPLDPSNDEDYYGV